MLAVNYSNYRESLKQYCDRVNDEAEVLIVTRKSGSSLPQSICSVILHSSMAMRIALISSV